MLKQNSCDRINVITAAFDLNGDGRVSSKEYIKSICDILHLQALHLTADGKTTKDGGLLRQESAGKAQVEAFANSLRRSATTCLSGGMDTLNPKQIEEIADYARMLSEAVDRHAKNSGYLLRAEARIAEVMARAALHKASR